MKKIKLIIVVAILAISSIGYSQGRGKSIDEVAREQTTLLKEKINDLSENQIAKLYDINVEYVEKNYELKRTGDRSQIQSKKEKLQKEKNEEVKPILSDDQYKIYLQLQSTQQNQGRRKRT